MEGKHLKASATLSKQNNQPPSQIILSRTLIPQKYLETHEIELLSM